MNVMFLLVPKCDVVSLSFNSSIRQAMETIRAHRRNVLPVLDDEGRYRGSISSNDLLNFLYEHESLSLKELEEYPLVLALDSESNPPLPAHVQFEELLDRLQEDNFVPINDDRGYFVGILTRRRLIQFLRQQIAQKPAMALPLKI